MQNLKQARAYQDQTRFKFYLAGRRGGKTFIIVEDILATAAILPPKAEIFYIGPSNQQAIELIWEPLQDRMEQMGWSFSPRVSKQRFELPGNRKIYVIGAEKIRRIRGHKVFKVFLDEIAFFQVPLGIIWKAIRPALSDFRGKGVVSTTPNGKGTDAYDFFLEAQKQPSWSTHQWFTSDNPWIDQDEIDEAKAELDEKSFLEEYEAAWESFVGLAYYNMSETLHIKEQPQINYEKPLCMAFDFNVNPTTLLLSQMDGRKKRLLKEYSFKHSSTEETVDAFVTDFREQNISLDLRIRGDASGKNRSSTTGRSDYQYIEEILTKNGFSYTKEVTAKNPPIIDRVKHVNGWLKPYQGTPRVEIDPSCENLIRDLTSQELQGRKPSDKNNLGHKADAMGYDIWWEHLTQLSSAQRGQTTIQL